jgi:hypothetical protein
MMGLTAQPDANVGGQSSAARGTVATHTSLGPSSVQHRPEPSPCREVNPSPASSLDAQVRPARAAVRIAATARLASSHSPRCCRHYRILPPPGRAPPHRAS